MSRLGDVYGSTVNIASRLTSIGARAGSWSTGSCTSPCARDPRYPPQVPPARVGAAAIHHLRQWRLRRADEPGPDDRQWTRPARASSAGPLSRIGAGCRIRDEDLRRAVRRARSAARDPPGRLGHRRRARRRGARAWARRSSRRPPRSGWPPSTSPPSGPPRRSASCSTTSGAHARPGLTLDDVYAHL